MDKPVIRQARPDERDALIELQRRASLANEGDREALLANPEAIDLPMDQIADGNVWVLEASGEPAGFAALVPRDDGQADLDGLFVEPDRWGHGYGRMLVEAAARRAHELGASILHVVANPHAERFYYRAGFHLTGQGSTQFGPALLMEMALP